MKLNLILFWTAIFFLFATSPIGFTAEKTQPLTAAVVIDTSPGQNQVKLLTIVKNIYSSLEPGDRILVFTARGNKTSLFASTTKTTNPDDYRYFSTIVDRVRYDWVLHADIAKGLSGSVFEHLVKRTSKSPVIIVVVTESEMATSQASKICSLADLLHAKYRWPLIITGTATGTNRQLLAASIQRRLYWCALAEAVDSAVLKKHISTAHSFAVAPYSRTTSKKIDAGDKKLSTGQPKSLPTKKKPATPSLPAPLKPERIVPPEKPSSPPTPKPAEAVSPPDHKKTSSLKVGTESGSGEKEKTVITPPAGPRDKKPLSKLAGWLRNPYILAVGAGGLVLAPIVCLIVVSWLRARDFAKKLVAPVAHQAKSLQPKVLVVKVNGATHRIGNVHRISRFHIGRDPSNTVTVNANKVAPRHLRIFRRGDRLFIRNLAGNSVVVNGITLKPRQKVLLSVPAIVEISDGAQIQFLWEKQPKSSVIVVGEQKNVTAGRK